MSTTKIWYPNGEGSESRIVADKCGTAYKQTVTITANTEMTPDEAVNFAIRIMDACRWLRLSEECR